MGVIFANKETIDKMLTIDDLVGHLLFEVPLNLEVDNRVSDHTDLSLFISDSVYVAPSIYNAFIKRLQSMKSAHLPDHTLFESITNNVVCGTNSLKAEYPYDIAYNAVILKNHFFHNLAYTEPKILMDLTCEKVNVGQGYTRCSTLVLTEHAVITEDAGLARHYRAHGYKVLVIEKGHILLPGFNYGFVGGAGGVIEDVLVLNGALRHHPDCNEIRAFVQQQRLKIVELHDGPLLDCGSILYLNT